MPRRRILSVPDNGMRHSTAVLCLPADFHRAVIPTVATSKTADAFVGIDVGGTTIKLGVIDARQNVVVHEQIPTARFSTPAAAFRQARSTVNQALSTIGDHRLAAVGLAVPGLVSEDRLQEIVNLPGWVGVPLSDLVAQTFGQPVAIVNDGHAAAVAEHHVRRARISSLAVVTLGTGVGCGLVIDGKLFDGPGGFAGELGHVVVAPVKGRVCGCGCRGHLEAYAGAAGVVQTARERLDEGADSDRLRTARLTPADICAAAADGDAVACQVVRDTAEKLGIALAGMMQVLGPMTVLLAGGLTFGGPHSPVGREFRRAIEEETKRRSLKQVAQRLVIDFASLGQQAGVIGAALMAGRSRLEGRPALTGTED